MGSSTVIFVNEIRIKNMIFDQKKRYQSSRKHSYSDHNYESLQFSYGSTLSITSSISSPFLRLCARRATCSVPSLEVTSRRPREPSLLSRRHSSSSRGDPLPTSRSTDHVRNPLTGSPHLLFPLLRFPTLVGLVQGWG